jgi:hypothetical protein
VYDVNIALICIPIAVELMKQGAGNNDYRECFSNNIWLGLRHYSQQLSMCSILSHDYIGLHGEVINFYHYLPS